MHATRFDPAFRDGLAELFRWRRDERHFLTTPLPDGEMLDLLRLAQLAPSVGNSQPWRFVRVRSASLRSRLAEHVDEHIALAGKAFETAEKQEAYRALKLHGLREAPEVLAVFCDETTRDGSGLGAATMPQARAYSVVLAIHTLWLAARARGIAVGWVSILDPVFVAGLLDAEPDWQLIALLCVGYPVAEAAVPELERRHWQTRNDWTATISAR